MKERSICGVLPPVGEIGLGCVGMSAEYGSGADWNHPSHGDLIRDAIDNGVTLIDTADSYGPFTNERLVGAAISEKRSQVVVSTKCGLVFEEGSGSIVPNGRPSHLRSACEGSLGRLGVDVIDLYFLHRVDPEVPLEESWGSMGELVSEGKVRALGLSEVSVDQLSRAHNEFPVACVQSELSLWSRGPLDEVLPWCDQNGAGFMAYAPLGRGFLTGAIREASFSADDIRRRNPRFRPEAMSANRQIVHEVEGVAAGLRATAAQVAISWVLSQGAHVIPIPGTKSRRHLFENIGASGTVLGAEALARLDNLPDPVGSRY